MSEEQTTRFTSIQDRRLDDAQGDSNPSFSVELDTSSANSDNLSEANSSRGRNIRKIYCSDGVVEEDEEEEEENARREEEEKLKAIEMRKKLDLEAVTRTLSFC
jgi:hypothetical protein